MSGTLHLVCRKGVWYYRRRVPQHLVGKLGKVVQFSLGTSNLAQAKKRREVADVEWSARFEKADKGRKRTNISPPAPDRRGGAEPPTKAQLTRLVWDLRCAHGCKVRENAHRHATRLRRQQVKADIEVGLQMLGCLDDPRAAELVYVTGAEDPQGGWSHSGRSRSPERPL